VAVPFALAMPCLGYAIAGWGGAALATLAVGVGAATVLALVLDDDDRRTWP